MFKNLRKLMMLLFAFVSVAAFAEEKTVTINFTTGSPIQFDESTVAFQSSNSPTSAIDGLHYQGIKFVADKGTATNAPNYFYQATSKAYCLNVIAKNNLGFEAPQGYYFEKIVFTFRNATLAGTIAPTISEGSYSYAASVGTWTNTGSNPTTLTTSDTKGRQINTIQFTLVSAGDSQKDSQNFDITEVTNAGNAAGTVAQWVNSYVVTIPEGAKLVGPASNITLTIPEYTTPYKCQNVSVNGTQAILSFNNVLENVIVEGDYKLNIPANVFQYEDETTIYKNNAYTATWTYSTAPKTPELGSMGWNLKYGMTYKAAEIAEEGVQAYFATDDAKQAAMQNQLYVEAVLSGMNLTDEGYTTVANGVFPVTIVMGSEYATATMFADAFAAETIYDSYRVEVTSIIFGERAYDEVSDKEVFTKIYHTFSGMELDAINPMPMAFSIDKSSNTGGDDSVIGTPKAIWKNGAVWVVFENNKFAEVCNDPDGWYDFNVSGQTIDGNLEYYSVGEQDPTQYGEVQFSQEGLDLAEGEHTLVIPAGQFVITYTDPITWASQTLYQNAEDITLTFTVGAAGPEEKDPITVTAEVADGLTKIYVQFNEYKYADAGENNIDLTNLSTYAMYSAEPWGVIDDSNNTVEYRIYETLPEGNYEVVINQGSAYVSNSNITWDESELCESAVANLTISSQQGGGEGNEGEVPTRDTILSASGSEIVDGGTYTPSDIATWTVKTVAEAKSNYMFVAKLFGGHMVSDPEMGSNWSEGSDEYVATVTVDNNHQFTATFAEAIPAGDYRLICRMINTSTYDWLVDTEIYITVDDTATGVKTITVKGDKAQMFNIAGQRVNNAKGIVIMNGKKVVK